MNYFLAGTLQEPLPINGFQGSPLLVGFGHRTKFLPRIPLRLYPLGGSTSSLSMRGQGVLYILFHLDMALLPEGLALETFWW